MDGRKADPGGTMDGLKADPEGTPLSTKPFPELTSELEAMRWTDIDPMEVGAEKGSMASLYGS